MFDVVEPCGVTAVTSRPSVTLPCILAAGVNSVELTVIGTDDALPAVVTAAGMIANVLPWLALRTIRSSSKSGVRDWRRGARGNSFGVFIRPSLASVRKGRSGG